MTLPYDTAELRRGAPGAPRCCCSPRASTRALHAVRAEPRARSTPSSPGSSTASPPSASCSRMTQFKEKSAGPGVGERRACSTTRCSWPPTSSPTTPSGSRWATTSASTSSSPATSPSASTTASATRSWCPRRAIPPVGARIMDLQNPTNEDVEVGRLAPGHDHAARRPEGDHQADQERGHRLRHRGPLRPRRQARACRTCSQILGAVTDRPVERRRSRVRRLAATARSRPRSPTRSSSSCARSRSATPSSRPTPPRSRASSPPAPTAPRRSPRRSSTASATQPDSSRALTLMRRRRRRRPPDGTPARTTAAFGGAGVRPRRVLQRRGVRDRDDAARGRHRHPARREPISASAGDKDAEIFSFFLSFVVIGFFWLAHHRFFARLAAVDAALHGDQPRCTSPRSRSCRSRPPRRHLRRRRAGRRSCSTRSRSGVASLLEAALLWHAQHEGLFRERDARRRVPRQHARVAGAGGGVRDLDPDRVRSTPAWRCSSWLLIFPLECVHRPVRDPEGRARLLDGVSRCRRRRGRRRRRAGSGGRASVDGSWWAAAQRAASSGSPARRMRSAPSSGWRR